MEQKKGWWASHGTKILGAVTVVIGAAGECLAQIEAADPKHAVLWALILGMGGAIIRRGFTNSNQAPPP